MCLDTFSYFHNSLTAHSMLCLIEMVYTNIIIWRCLIVRPIIAGNGLLKHVYIIYCAKCVCVCVCVRVLLKLHINKVIVYIMNENETHTHIFLIE